MTLPQAVSARRAPFRRVSPAWLAGSYTPAVLRVRDLVADPALGLTLVGGRAGLERAVTSAHVSELLDPAPWLEGGELLMTAGLALPTSRAGARAYVDRLAAAGVAAVGLGLGAQLRHQSAPRALAAAADDVGIPLLEVPERTPFLAVTKAVFERLAAEEYAAVTRASDAQRALTAAVLRPGGIDGLVSTLAAATGLRVVVTDAAGRAVVARPQAAVEDVEEVRAELTRLRAVGLRGSAAVGGPGGGIDVAPLGVDRLLGFLVSCGPGTPAPAQRIVLATAASLLSLELERRRAAEQEDERRRGELLRRLLAAPTSGERAGELLAEMGCGQPDSVRVVAVAGATEPLTPALRSRGAVHLAGEVDVLLVPGPASDLADVLARELGPGRAGVSRPVPPGAAPVALEQARRALETARRRSVPVVDAAALGATQLLLAMGDARLVRAAAQAVLAPLEKQDPRGELLRSLRAYLDANGAWEVAAAGLGVHRHTLRARMRRVEDLTGRRLDSADDRVELYLALQLSTGSS